VQDRVPVTWRRLADNSGQPVGVDRGRAVRSTEPVRVLIVDNDRRSADEVARMLNASGYSQTRVAYSGHAALAAATDFQPGVVLLELDLTDLDCYDLAQWLRERAQSEDLRLIAMTSSREHTAREQARVAGFERYLLKPVTSLDLSHLLERPSR
jgi:CheY-like chemotaxis protein